MKKYLFILVLPLLINISFSQDTVTNYLPLKVGNVWVYYGSSNRVRLKIINTIITNNHTYYVFDQAGTLCNCAQGTFPPFLSSPSGPFRIDSITGNLFRLAGSPCSWHNGEELVDTLRIRMGSAANNSCYYLTCLDTSQQNVFGNMRKTKQMGISIPTYYTLRRYAYGIGLVNSIKGCFFSSCGYNLLGCVIDGTVYGDTGFVTGINQISLEIPDHFSLSQNYPNPFNPMTNVKFQMPKQGYAKITVFDVLGKDVQTLVNQQLSPGTYEADFDGSNLPSGVYYYQLTISNEQLTLLYKETRKMVLIK